MAQRGESAEERLRMKRPLIINGRRMCKQCLEYKPLDQFLVAKTRGHDNVFCNECATENMHRWARTPLADMTVDKIKEISE
jgi:superfamily II helicase